VATLFAVLSKIAAGGSLPLHRLADDSSDGLSVLVSEFCHGLAAWQTTTVGWPVLGITCFGFYWL